MQLQSFWNKCGIGESVVTQGYCKRISLLEQFDLKYCQEQLFCFYLS